MLNDIALHMPKSWDFQYTTKELETVNINYIIVEECILLRLYTIKYDNHVTSLATIVASEVTFY
jgi:hypothetical protein